MHLCIAFDYIVMAITLLLLWRFFYQSPRVILEKFRKHESYTTALGLTRGMEGTIQPYNIINMA